MLNNYTKIHTTLKQLREQEQLTQTELASYFGCGESLIEKWENGVEEPTITEALVLSKLYGISLDDMFSDFDVSSFIPSDCKESFDNVVRIHSVARPCYK